MEKIEKLFDSAWGVVIFYAVVALVSLIMVTGFSKISSPVSQSEEIRTTYYA